MKGKVFLFFLFAQTIAVAQKSGEFGVMLGGTNYLGELSAERTDNFHFAGGITGRWNMNHYLAIRGNVFYGNISGADSNNTSQAKRDRNLSFKSPLFEVSGLLEWNLFGFDPIGGQRDRVRKKMFSPYVFTGIAMFKFNPMAYLDNNWVELQPLGTEGQGTTPFQDRKKYNLTTFSIPMGVGIKLRLAPRLVFAAEYGMRITFTDYLDDISKTFVDPQILAAAFGGPNSNSVRLADRSPDEVRAARSFDPLTFDGPVRGESNNKDSYNYAGFTLTYVFTKNKVKCFAF